MQVFGLRSIVKYSQIFIIENRMKMSTNFNIKERSSNGTRIDGSDMSPKHRHLVAFDFDHTVVADNTDIVVRDLISKNKIPNEVKFLYTDSGWIPYMGAVFKILHANGIRRNDMLTAIESIPEVAGMKDLIRKLYASQDTDVIIVSDSNSQFIGHWCRHNGIDECIKKIFTNPAEFDANELLNIQPYHNQLTCLLSSVNLCKGDILADYIHEQQESNGVTYRKIFYVGDGNNDLCPILRLGKEDVGCARHGYRLQRDIQALSAKNGLEAADVENAGKESSKNFSSLDAEIFAWNDGNDLSDFIFQTKI